MERFGKFILLPFDNFENCLKNNDDAPSTLAPPLLELTNKNEKPLADPVGNDPPHRIEFTA